MLVGPMNVHAMDRYGDAASIPRYVSYALRRNSAWARGACGWTFVPAMKSAAMSNTGRQRATEQAYRRCNLPDRWRGAAAAPVRFPARKRLAAIQRRALPRG